MTRKLSAAVPSAGFWLIVASWAAAAAFVVWGSREPRLDRMKRELDRLASTDGATASDWLVTNLRRELPHRPDLSAALTGESGARALEARQDGFTRSAHFHVAIAARLERLELRSTTPVSLTLGGDHDRVRVELTPERPTRLAIRAAWRGPALVEATRSGGDALILVRGTEETAP